MYETMLVRTRANFFQSFWIYYWNETRARLNEFGIVNRSKSCTANELYIGALNVAVSGTSYFFRIFTDSTSGVNQPGFRLTFCCFWNIKICCGTFVYSIELKFFVFHVSIYFCAYVWFKFMFWCRFQCCFLPCLCQLSMLKTFIYPIFE